MISARPTKNLTGITLEGTYDDLYEIVDSIYRLTGIDDDRYDPYFGVKNRLLGMCYDIRHAYQGDRDIRLEDNGMTEDLMKWHGIIAPKKEVRYAVDIMFTEAVFVALSVSEIYGRAKKYYGSKTKKNENIPQYIAHDYSQYARDKAVLDTLSAVILQAFEEVSGEEELEKIIKAKDRDCLGMIFYGYATLYVDKCNIEYLKTAPEKRPAKLKNIAKRFVTNPVAYKNFKDDLTYWAKYYECTIYDLKSEKLEYPETIEW